MKYNRKPHLEQDLNRSWVFVEQRDLDEDQKIREEIESLGLPTHIIDAHVHCGLRRHIGEIPLARLQKVKTLNNRRWYSVPSMRELHEDIFNRTNVGFVVFPLPYLETKIDKVNSYLINAVRTNETVLILGDPSNISSTIQTIESNKQKVSGVKAYYDQIPTDKNADPEEISNFAFFPRELLSYLNDNKLSIMLHVSRQGGVANKDTLGEVLEIAKTYPQLKVILAHMGRCYNPIDFQKVVSGLAVFSNIYFETSMVDDPQVFTIALQAAGAKRILFGTDLPLSQVRFIRQMAGERQITYSKQESNAIRITNKPDMAIAMNVLYMTKALLQSCKELKLSEGSIQDIFYNNAFSLLFQAFLT